MTIASTLKTNHNLVRILTNLKNRSEDIRLKAAKNLNEFLDEISREYTAYESDKITRDVFHTLTESLKSSYSYERMGAIQGLDHLAKNSLDSSSDRKAKIQNCLKIALPNSDTELMKMAAEVLGKLVLESDDNTSKLIDFEVKRSFEWLQGDPNELRRHASMLILNALILNAPTLMYGYISEIFNLIWVAVHDNKIVIREAAAEVLKSSLQVMLQRDSPLHISWYSRVWEEAIRGLSSNSLESVHGSFLTLHELIAYSGKFVNSKYAELCTIYLNYKDHREHLIRKAIIQTIPTLSEYDPDTFVTMYLDKFATYLIAQLRRDREKYYAFSAIGYMAKSIESKINPYIPDIIANIKENLLSKNKSKQQADPQVFECISLLSISVGRTLSTYANELLDLMIGMGLSAPLVQALTDLSTNISSVLPTVQSRLLDMISLVLSGQNYIPSGSPLKNPIPESSVKDLIRLELYNADLVVLSLDTLGRFNFFGHSLSEFIYECVIYYLEDHRLNVRRSAALTCCKLLSKDPICHQTSAHAIRVINDVLFKLLMAGVADPDSTIRHTVISNLDGNFDLHLAQTTNFKTLSLGMNDEYFPVREATIEVISRFAHTNPASALPFLRKELIKALTELEYSTESRVKQENSKMIGLIITSSPTLTQPYIDPIIQALLSKSKDPNAIVSSNILATVGDLVKMGGSELEPYIEEIVLLIIESLQDQSSSIKRSAALKAFSQLARSTGYVIEPYTKYPQLMPILVDILKTEQNPQIRKETIRLIGILGAINPYKLITAEAASEESSSGPKVASKTKDLSMILIGMVPSSEDYYPTVVISSLLKIMKDPSLFAYHRYVIESFMNIFSTLGLKIVSFLPLIVPAYLSVVRSSPVDTHQFYFKQLSNIVLIVKHHIRNFLPEIFKLVQDFWSTSTETQITLMTLIESISTALGGEFNVYIPSFLPQLLQVLDSDSTESHRIIKQILQTIVSFGSSIQECCNLIIPSIVKLLEKPEISLLNKKAAIQTIGMMFINLQCSDLASQAVHSIARVLYIHNDDLRREAVRSLYIIAYQTGESFIAFIPLVKSAMYNNQIQDTKYDSLIKKILRSENLYDSELESLIKKSAHTEFDEPSSMELGSSKKLSVSETLLKRAWEALQRSTKEDWFEWFKKLSLELLRQSPSHALRACANLASAYLPLSRELFNAAFVSCWTELQDHNQDELIRSLEIALASPTIPNDILQQLLNLAEFMEHDDKTLPIDIGTLGMYASRCHAYAKALHYKELEFISEPTPKIIEELIGINNQLQQPDAAVGILTYAQRHHQLELQETWYEKLGRWDDALNAYNRKEEEEGVDMTLGKMRCLYNLGEFHQLAPLVEQKWDSFNAKEKEEIAPYATGAIWSFGELNSLSRYTQSIKPDNPDYSFYRAVLALHHSQFDQAQAYIDRTRNILDSELTALIAESYSRAYPIIVQIQMLSELEEVIQYKLFADQPDRQATMRKTWIKRLKGCQPDVNVWHRTLSTRSFVLSPSDDLELWIKFANLSRKNGRLALSENTLNMLLQDVKSKEGSGISPNYQGADGSPTHVIYAHLKHGWATGAQHESLESLKYFTQQLANDLGFTNLSDPHTYPDMNQVTELTQQGSGEYVKLLASCFLKQAEWQVTLQDNWNEATIPTILHSFLLATQFDRHWYKAWHAWAIANFEVVNYYRHSDTKVYQHVLSNYVVPAVHGFFQSIGLSSGNSLQDTLRLLTLWFEYGSYSNVNSAIAEGFSSVSIDNWLQVIPQIIARINAPSSNVRKLIHQLLTEIGKEHPQALVYPIAVASKSHSMSRKNSALIIMDHLRGHSPQLVEQAIIVSEELIRVAILWHEMWHEGLEEASRMYFGDKNIDGMFTTLEPLHQMLERGPETLREISFNQAFGRDLQEAYEWCQTYKQTLNIACLNQAWDLYRRVFTHINNQLPQITTLELKYFSPKLLAARDLDLAIPGSYRSGEPIVKIGGFSTTLNVITSKQRPRKLTIQGSDGAYYQYLLKGHEDLRQDERVMQLFGLVNTLLETDSETFKRQLNIERYPVIPLSPNSGLIGWVPHSDTLHALIRDYRDSRKILLNIEHRLMLQMAPEFDKLPLLKKVEVFEYALDNTTGQDLCRVLWLKSKNSESWLARRTCYTRSLATMSMVGYILGLGDRHPSNLMLDRYSGKVIHIDFGDCFEVAMHRDKFPERIPFRLTRMLTNAMEVCGIEGNYRTTCENVLRVLRDNKESLMAVLEAFVYDPLINWRLLSRQSPPPKSINDNKNPIDNSASEHKFPSSHKPDANPTYASKEHQESEEHHQPEVLNKRALTVINRVSNKLTGRDFDRNQVLDVPQQVDKLIHQATSLENLCQCYVGWCAFW